MDIEIDNDILEGFIEESTTLLNELSEIAENLEEVEKDFPSKLLEDFSQKIDRIMGASDTISQMAPNHPGFKRISGISRLCKTIGYEAARKQKVELIPIFAGFWADTIEVMESLLTHIRDLKKSEEIAKSFSSVLEKRLEWLADKVGIEKNDESVNVEELLADLKF